MPTPSHAVQQAVPVLPDDGIGTLEEVVEQLTWAQLGRHQKPILIANVSGYWDPLLTLIEHMRKVKFVPSAFNVDFLVATRVEDILPAMRKAAQSLWFENGIAADLSGAAAIAALQSGAFRPDPGSHVCAIVCGAGNDGQS